MHGQLSSGSQPFEVQSLKETFDLWRPRSISNIIHSELGSRRIFKLSCFNSNSVLMTRKPFIYLFKKNTELEWSSRKALLALSLMMSICRCDLL